MLIWGLSVTTGFLTGYMLYLAKFEFNQTDWEAILGLVFLIGLSTFFSSGLLFQAYSGKLYPKLLYSITFLYYFYIAIIVDYYGLRCIKRHLSGEQNLFILTSKEKIGELLLHRYTGLPFPGKRFDLKFIFILIPAIHLFTYFTEQIFEIQALTLLFSSTLILVILIMFLIRIYSFFKSCKCYKIQSPGFLSVDEKEYRIRSINITDIQLGDDWYYHLEIVAGENIFRISTESRFDRLSRLKDTISKYLIS